MAVASLAPAFLVFLLLMWTFGLVLALLRKVLDTPSRDVRVTVRPLPWPRIEIDARARPIDAESRESG